MFSICDFVYKCNTKKVQIISKNCLLNFDFCERGIKYVRRFSGSY